MTWLERLLTDGVPERFVPVLLAFGGHHAPAPHHIAESLNVVEVLSAEVDRQQAEMFLRRFEAVRKLLSELQLPALTAGFTHRAWEVLHAPGPRAIRFRALVDFYWSQCAVERHRSMNHTPLFDILPPRYTQVATGIEHARLCGPTEVGPVRINLLRVTGRRMRAVDCRGQGSLVEVAHRAGATAAISGGFFLYSEPDIAPWSRRTDPVGLLVSDGEVLSPPVFPRSAVLQRADGRYRIERIGLPDVLTRAAAKIGPDEPSVAVVGDRVVARGRRLTVPLNGYVAPAPRAWDLGEVRDAMAGGPALLGFPDAIDRIAEGFCGSAPPVTFAHDETGDANLLPRMAVGVDAQGRLVAAAVDGRNVEVAPGFTLRQLQSLMRGLDCVQAMNLDGGSSKRMVICGEQVDLSTTEVVGSTGSGRAVRPVNTALLFS